jgi:outer membrane lipoprotein carrier protein
MLQQVRRSRVFGPLNCPMIWPIFALVFMLTLGMCFASPMAHAAGSDASEAFRAFVRDVQSGRAQFTQTVTSPDGKKKKTSSGSFEFSRPNRFRFEYTRPFQQLIVADGRKVWFYDPDLNQVSVRPLTQALADTPASILTGGDLDRDFDLTPLPEREGLSWVQANPKKKDGAFQLMRVGFRDRTLAALDIVDGFGSLSALRFEGFAANASIKPDRLTFTPPPGADLVEP